MQVRLRNTVIDRIKRPDVRRKLAEALNCTDQTVIRHINNNDANGELTKLAALTVIEDELGTPMKSIIESCAKV